MTVSQVDIRSKSSLFFSYFMGRSYHMRYCTGCYFIVTPLCAQDITMNGNSLICYNPVVLSRDQSGVEYLVSMNLIEEPIR